jgi:engulfment and cell motility protein 1
MPLRRLTQYLLAAELRLVQLLPGEGDLCPQTVPATTKDGTTVRARIDPTLAVDDVIRQLCMNLKVSEPPVLFALRDEADELVTDDNLRKKIRGKVNLKYVPLSPNGLTVVEPSLASNRLVSAPIIEAAEIVDKLSIRDERTLRMTVFSLQKFIPVSWKTSIVRNIVNQGDQEEQFANEFLQRDGLKELIDVIAVSHGNTLAVRRSYDLSCLPSCSEPGHPPHIDGNAKPCGA